MPNDSRFVPSVEPECGANGFEIVLITLTLPLWTFAILTFLYLLIKYLRRIQYFELYDKCQARNAHFSYVFHLIIGKHTINYDSNQSHLILDLLDNQMISTMTIQIPSSTLFNESQIFTFRHSRKDLRCVDFTIYRRNPMKEIQCVRLAHGCSNQDSRLFVYGLSLTDVTNNENKFFPITSPVKYRANHSALNTTYEAKGDLNFSKLGCDCYDPFRLTSWPSYGDILLLLFYIWSAAFFFGHVISIDAIFELPSLHGLVVGFITTTSAAVIAFIYLRLIKVHIVDQHFESVSWKALDVFVTLLMFVLCLAFWFTSFKQLFACETLVTKWAISTTAAAIVISICLLVVYHIFARRKQTADNSKLAETDNTLQKANSKQNLEFAKEPAFNFCFFRNKQTTNPAPPVTPPTSTTKKSISAQKTVTKSSSSKATPLHKNFGSGSKRKFQDSDNNQHKRNNDEDTLETAYGSDGRYIKTKNRNSISQYV